MLPEKPLYILTLPQPDVVLRPNTSCHLMKKARFKKKAREAARYYAFALFGCLVYKRDFKPYKKAQIKRYYYFKDERHPDEDNLDASTKHHTDGICDTGIIKNDKGIHWLESVILIDKEKQGFMEYHFYELV